MYENKTQGVMKDWAGNIAQEGDTIHFVSILVTQPNVIVIDPDTGKQRVINAQTINGPYFMWNPYYSTRVFEQDGVLFCQMPPLPGHTYNVMPINMVYENWRDTGAWDIGSWICIERNKPNDKFNTLNQKEFFKFFFRQEITNKN